MLQSQIINVLPRRILASLWATQETRISLSHLTALKPVDNNSNNKSSFYQSQQPAVTLPSFLCTELPVRYTHILRLLSTLSPDSLQSPIIRNVAHSYLYDICTLLHPSLKSTSPKAFSKVLSKIRNSQSKNLVRLKYALLSNPTNATVALMDNINTINFGIHNLIDQHLSWDENKDNNAQKINPEEIAHQAIQDAKHTLSTAFGSDRVIPSIEIKTCSKNMELTYVPSILHRILYEASLLSLKAQAVYNEENQTNWLKRQWKQRVAKTQQPDRPLSLRIFGGPTSVGFRLDATAPLIERDLLPSIPRDVMGTPTCSSILSSTSSTTIDASKETMPWVDWESLSGWRSMKSLASHFGGNLDAVTVDGLGSTIYLALDRDTTLLERYPSRMAFAASAQSLLRHHRRTSAAITSADKQLSIQAAATQLDAFLYAISDSQQVTLVNPTPLYHHHSVSLSAAAGNA